MIKENLIRVRDEMKKACENAGRDISDVSLIAVSKTKPIELLKEAYSCGQLDFGENKVQEICEKKPLMPDDVRWHMIGHLQTNKIKQVIDKAVLIHSVDTVKLALALEKACASKNLDIDVLLEINSGNEESKFGFTFDEVKDNLDIFGTLKRVHVQGLMTVAPFVKDQEDNRSVFRKMYELYIDIGNKKADNVNMRILSMGMSNDYRVAIEEGATMVRIGTDIFGARVYI